MYSTIEVRWFLRGTIPAGVWDWYDQWGADLGEQPARVDYYLRINDGDSLGVKLREGRIEFKQRYGQNQAVPFGHQTAGCVERWRKWSFALTESEGVLAAMHSSRWVGVKKERLLRTFGVRDNETVIAVPVGDPLFQGCGWEVARVGIEDADEAWWSVGFEAFGDEGGLQELFLMVAERLLSAGKAPRFGLEASYGYPRWLQLFEGVRND